MIGWFGSLTGLERGFTICALIGAVVFTVRLVLQLVGGDVGDGEPDALDMPDSDVGFRFVSVHGVSAFLLLFGLVGRALLLDSQVRPGIALAGALGAGLAAMWVITTLFRLMLRLQSSGNVEVADAVGREGTVYLSIPAGGRGQVRVTLGGRLQVCDAVTADGGALATGARIVVTGASGPDLLVVQAKE